VHSLDQIIYGFLLGAWIALTMHFCFRPSIDSHLTTLLQNKQREFWELIVVSSIFFAFVIMGQVVDFYIMNKNITARGGLNPLWIENIAAKCGPVKFESSF